MSVIVNPYRFGLVDDAVPASTRWRVYADEVRTPGNNFSFSEIHLAETSGGANACTGGTATASSNYPGQSDPNYALDGNTATKWISNGGVPGAWWEYQFASAKAIVEMRVKSRNDSWTSESLKRGRLQYYDGSTWVDWIYAASQPDWPGSIVTEWIWRNLGGTATGYYRFWRARQTDDFSQSLAAWSEVQFRGEVGGPDLTDPAFASGHPIGSDPTNFGEVPRFAFDDNTGTSSVTVTNRGHIGWRFDRPTLIREISLRATGNPALAYKSFVVEGSMDGVTYTTVKTVTNEPSWSSGETRTYSW